MALIPLGMELQVPMSIHMGAGNWTLVLGEEQPVLLTAELSFQIQEFNFVYFKEKYDGQTTTAFS